MLVVLILVCVVCRRRKKEDEKVSEAGEEECTEKQEDTEDKSDPSLFKQVNEPTETDTLADLIIAPKLNERFDLKNDGDEQERPHSMKAMEKLTQDPSFEVFVDISGQQPEAEENTEARVNELDERPVQKKKKKKKKEVETLDEVVAANNVGIVEPGEVENETNTLDETVERPKRKRKKRDQHNEVVEGEMVQTGKTCDEEVGKKDSLFKRCHSSGTYSVGGATPVSSHPPNLPLNEFPESSPILRRTSSHLSITCLRIIALRKLFKLHSE
ncbi:hypothetical protein BLNAU_9884 [Blattamonas nauphoetae]|uniref:Uncharacterized protein n=1 Tax=Blattamonas nauphoetae TaxID=2049346 RepID=A0ABQ9XUJ9_9EUKA|nr:hypothetical protein BLNAU_9884 [Blattamonas nauphoetae]